MVSNGKEFWNAMKKADAYRSVLREGLFDGAVALVTGGGSGIGRCVAHEMASLGAFVVVAGRKAEKLERVVAEVVEDGGRAEASSLDIRDEDAVKSMVADIVLRHGRIDHLVNNAGGQFPSPLETISKKGFDAVIATNLTGGFLAMREVFNASMRKHGGAIVNMLAAMHNGMPGMAHSGAARAGMGNLTRTAAFEWAHAGVRVNAVAPGWIASSGMDNYGPAMKPIIQNLARHVPMRRLGLEAEVSAAICFLLSPAASFITGTVLNIDGAATLGDASYPLPAKARAPAFDGFHRAVMPEILKPSDGQGG
jgi:citronellol/citronellal dehydrogenase